MSQPFEISFDFALDDSDFIVSLRARAELHHSTPYYIVDDFHVRDNPSKKHGPSILPAQEIRKIVCNNKTVWVHKDSEMESMLSRAIGKAIEEKGD